jgi:hypothetical protein
MLSDGNSIVSVIKRYMVQYNEEHKLPYIKNIVNSIESNNIDDKINPNKEDDIYPLFECYNYFSNTFNTNEFQKTNKKIIQSKKICEKINSFANIKTVQEYCCGKSLFANEIVKIHNNSTYYGYDINNRLLEINKANTNNNCNFIQKDLLQDNYDIINEKDNLIICLHGCGILHNKLLENLNNLSYKGNFMIIPCCYFKHRKDKKSVKLDNFNLEIPYSLLKTMSLLGSREQFYKKYYEIGLLKVKFNLVYKYIFENIVNPDDCVTDDNTYTITKFKENKYIPICNKFCSNKKDEASFFTQLFNNKIFHIKNYDYDNCKDIIRQFDDQAEKIHNSILNEKFNIIQPLCRLIEILLIYDYAITLQKNTKLKISVETIFPYNNSPKNIAIIGKN